LNESEENDDLEKEYVDRKKMKEIINSDDQAESEEEDDSGIC